MAHPHGRGRSTMPRMRTASLIIAVLGAVLAVQAHAMPQSEDSSRATEPRVAVQNGVAWFYGHRFEAPFTLEYCDDGLAINGSFLPREVRLFPKSRPGHGDTLRAELSARALEILRDAQRNHVPRDEAFAQIEQLYRSCPLVKRAELRGYSLRTSYKDRSGDYILQLVDPERVAMRDMALEESSLKERGTQSKHLLQLKDHLESGGSILWFDSPGYVLLPKDDSARIDAILQRMQQKEKITKEEGAFLQSLIPASLGELSRMAEQPKRLLTLFPHPEAR